MYRQIFIPVEGSDVISLAIPSEWYGLPVEVIAFPIGEKDRGNIVEENIKKKKKLHRNTCNENHNIAITPFVSALKSGVSLSADYDYKADYADYLLKRK